MHACHGRCIELGVLAGTWSWPAAPAVGHAGFAVGIAGAPTARGRVVAVRAKGRP